MGNDKSGDPIEFMVAVYPKEDQADGTLDILEEMHHKGSIEILEAAVLVRDSTGDLKIHRKARLTHKKGALRGVLIGSVIGIVFPPSILAAAAFGAGVGAAMGHDKVDIGLPDDYVDELAAQVDPGESAIIAVLENKWLGQLVDGLEGFEKLYRHSLDANVATGLVFQPTDD